MRLHWLLPEIKGIPVLMYHRVWPGRRDGLTLPPEALREQWQYLQDEGYQCLKMVNFLAVMRGEAQAPQKSFLLTFDDGYRNNLQYVLPLLQVFGWEATLFIITGTLDGSYSRSNDDALNEKLSLQELRAMCGPNICFGLHGYQHENFSQTAVNQLQAIMRVSCQVFEQAGLPYEKVLAYPYGARPKDTGAFNQLKAWMEGAGIEAAFRIGNQPQRWPARDLYELKRIDIRGEDALADFRIKLRKGKLKPF